MSPKYFRFVTEIFPVFTEKSFVTAHWFNFQRLPRIAHELPLCYICTNVHLVQFNHSNVRLGLVINYLSRYDLSYYCHLLMTSFIRWQYNAWKSQDQTWKNDDKVVDKIVGKIGDISCISVKFWSITLIFPISLKSISRFFITSITTVLPSEICKGVVFWA